jgi:hypothetical protein
MAVSSSDCWLSPSSNAPVKQWIGFEVVNHHATDGIAIGECYLYDEDGPIGTSTVAALAQRKPMAKPPP